MFHELEEVLILAPFLFLDCDEFLQIDFLKMHLLRKKLSLPPTKLQSIMATPSVAQVEIAKRHLVATLIIQSINDAFL